MSQKISKFLLAFASAGMLFGSSALPVCAADDTTKADGTHKVEIRLHYESLNYLTDDVTKLQNTLRVSTHVDDKDTRAGRTDFKKISEEEDPDDPAYKDVVYSASIEVPDAAGAVPSMTMDFNDAVPADFGTIVVPRYQAADMDGNELALASDTEQSAVKNDALHAIFTYNSMDDANKDQVVNAYIKMSTATVRIVPVTQANERLNGVEYEIIDEDTGKTAVLLNEEGKTVKFPYSSSDDTKNGIATFKGLLAGHTYTVRATKVPDGYKKPQDIGFKVAKDRTMQGTNDYSSETMSLDETKAACRTHHSITAWVIPAGDGVELPSAGGTGTAVPTAIACMTACAAVIYIIVRKNKKVED